MVTAVCVCMRPVGPVVSAEQRFGGRRRAPGRGKSRDAMDPTAVVPFTLRQRHTRGGLGSGVSAPGGRQARSKRPPPAVRERRRIGPANLLGIRNGCQWLVAWEPLRSAPADAQTLSPTTMS
jgi:hypothetical protein